MPNCKYGLACNRKDCVFKHPSGPRTTTTINTGGSSSDYENEVCLPFLAGTCAFGDSCFSWHPSPKETESIKKKFALKWCKFGNSCKTKGCLYKHGSSSPLLTPTSGGHVSLSSAPVILATGPLYVEPPSLKETLEKVNIPRGLYLTWDDSLAGHAFNIKDPIERFGFVNDQHGNVDHPEDCFVLDLHFQSCKSVLVVLDQIIPQCIDYLESPLGENKQIWLVTGAGNHVPKDSHQQKGGVLYDTVLDTVLAKAKGFSIAEGLDANGCRGAVRIRKK
jgi:hypothetical protein